MLNFTQLDDNEISNVLKLVNEKDFHSFAKKDKTLTKSELLKMFNTPSIDSIGIGAARVYFKNNLYKPDDTFVKFYTKLISSKIDAEFKSRKKLETIIGEASNDELNEDQVKQICSYQKEFEESGLKLDFSSFIKMLCQPSDTFQAEKEIKMLQQELKKAKDECQKLRSELDDAKRTNAELEKDNRKYKRDNGQLTSQMEKLKANLSIDTAMHKLSKLLPADFNSSDPVEVMKELDRLDNVYFDAGQYEKQMDILVGKYGIDIILKGNK